MTIREAVYKAKPMKPYMATDGVVVRHLTEDDCHKAALLLINTVAQQNRYFRILHLPIRSCTSCRDPSCRKEGSDGYWIAEYNKTE